MFADMGVLYIQVVITGFDVVDTDLPGLLALDAVFEAIFFVSPPGDLGLCRGPEFRRGYQPGR